jgi:hypothetical protein
MATDSTASGHRIVDSRIRIDEAAIKIDQMRVVCRCRPTDSWNTMRVMTNRTGNLHANNMSPMTTLHAITEVCPRPRLFKQDIGIVTTKA